MHFGDELLHALLFSGILNLQVALVLLAVLWW